jgi:hypothetical protein
LSAVDAMGNHKVCIQQGDHVATNEHYNKVRERSCEQQLLPRISGGGDTVFVLQGQFYIGLMSWRCKRVYFSSIGFSAY